MKRTHEDSKIEEMSSMDLSKLDANTVYQVKFTKECKHAVTQDGITNFKAWSLFLVEHKETK